MGEERGYCRWAPVPGRWPDLPAHCDPRRTGRDHRRVGNELVRHGTSGFLREW